MTTSSPVEKKQANAKTFCSQLNAEQIQSMMLTLVKDIDLIHTVMSRYLKVSYLVDIG